MLAQAAPQAGHHAHAEQHPQTRWPEGARHLHQRGRRRADERPLQGVVHQAGLLAKTLKTLGLVGPGKFGHGLDGLQRVGMQVQARAIGPGMARQHRQG